MKISGVGPPVVPADGTAPPEDVARPAERFADKVSSGATAGGATRPGGAGQGTAVGPLDDIAAELQAGKISAKAAIDKVVDRVVAAQVAPGASAEVRAQVSSALRRALEEDPLLAAKLRALGG